ncbi:eukaryotic translation initiation factor 4e, putative [Eimeria acervulina]|uniref:Eukaryotic translation initiation factor 4e, putative n=1 Tax=Eimeria acervulina TaxID=5801 RepID=U6GCC8_EIMAC|nr:eukaryotic translation initiation factor 4e, putative [Eimeria acervulina]CDI77182.1 eukaryotic translation initiation factor 4e, putative [Eimeria acervulina]
MATRFLSFNPSVSDAVNLDECITEERPADSPLPLQHRWHVWEQIQRETTPTFWQLWAHIPQPSELLGHKRMVRQDNNGRSHVVDALMIFKSGHCLSFSLFNALGFSSWLPLFI